MNQVILADSGSRQEFLRSLSYLELCTVPSLIPLYLELFDIGNLRNIFVLNCQTYLDLHHNYHNHSPHSTEFQHFIRQSSLKSIGEQLMYFLKMICLHCLSHQLPLQQLFLNIDPTTEMHTIALQKIVLTSLHHHEEASVHVDYISALISLVELSTEIHAIRGGHSKAMTFKATGNYGQSLKLRHQQSRKLEDVEQSLAMLVSDQHESYVRFANVGQQLVRKYQFVVQEACKVDPLEFPSLDMNLQRQCIDDMVDQEGLGDDIFAQLQLHCQLEEKQMFIAQLHFDCLRNIEHLPLEIVAKTYNTVSATVHQLFRQYQPTQNQNNANLQEKISSAKANTYCLLHATKALLASRQPISQLPFLQELQVSLRELFEFKLPKIEKIWLLLYSIIQGSLTQSILTEKCAAIFDWVIQFYVKNYPIKEAQYIYADYLIVCKNLLGCWNKDKNSLLEAVSDWLKKPYEDEQFRLMFETLPVKMVHSLAISVFKNGRISSNIESQTQLGQSVNVLVEMNRQVIKECMQLLRKGNNNQQMQEQQQQVKKNQHWQIVINVWLQRCSKEEGKTSLQALLWARTVQLINNFNSPSPLPHKISMIPLLAAHCLHECTNLVVSAVNFIQLELVQSNKRNAAAAKIVEENNQLKLKLQFLSKIQQLMAFLACLIFTINPAHYTQYLLHAFVINGYLQDMPFETTINQLYNSSLKNIRNNQLLTPSNYEPILTYAPIYDTLQSFYDLIMTRPHVSQQILTRFETFCKKWCGQQDNYQWISQLKTSKIKLMRFKNYCLTHHSH